MRAGDQKGPFLSFLGLHSSPGLSHIGIVERVWTERDKEGWYEKAKSDSSPTLAHVSELFAN